MEGWISRVQNLVSTDKLGEAIDVAREAASRLDRDFFNEVIVLSRSYQATMTQIRLKASDNSPVEINRIAKSVLEISEKLQVKINELFEEAKKSELNNDLHRALATYEKLIQISSEEKFRQDRDKLSKRMLDPIEEEIPDFLKPKIDKFSFFWVFVVSFCLVSILPIILFIIKSRLNQADLNISMQLILFFFNFSLQISVIICMIMYPIKKRVSIPKFISSVNDYILSKFDHKIQDVKWFAARANAAIDQFGRWWKWLGWSFLSLYALYFIIECTEIFIPDPATSLSWHKLLRDFVDVIINGSEAYFLFILYRILFDDTIKPDDSDNSNRDDDIKFVEDLNIQRQSGISVFILFLFITTYGIISLSDPYHIPSFSLISRTISGAFVGVGLCLVIGRLDSKLIDPKKWELFLLYLYGSIQVLFTLFDPVLFMGLGNISEKDQIAAAIQENVGNIKISILYIVLLLKVYFIFFVIKIYQNGSLFNYFLLGTKLNEEIKASKDQKKGLVDWDSPFKR